MEVSSVSLGKHSHSAGLSSAYVCVCVCVCVGGCRWVGGWEGGSSGVFVIPSRPQVIHAGDARINPYKE